MRHFLIALSPTTVAFQKRSGTLPCWQPTIAVAASQAEMFLLPCISPSLLQHKLFISPSSALAVSGGMNLFQGIFNLFQLLEST